MQEEKKTKSWLIYAPVTSAVQISRIILPNSLQDIHESGEKMLQFLNKRDHTEDINNVYICELHFEETFLNRNEDRVRLVNAKHPQPTIFPGGIDRKSISTVTLHNT